MKQIIFSLKYFKLLIFACIFFTCIIKSNENHEIKNKSQQYLRHWLYALEPDINSNQNVKENKTIYIGIVENHIKKLNKKLFSRSLNTLCYCILLLNVSASSFLDIVAPRFGYSDHIYNYFLNRYGVLIGIVDTAIISALWNYERIDLQKKLEHDHRILEILKSI